MCLLLKFLNSCLEFIEFMSRLLKLPEADRRRHDLSSVEFCISTGSPWPQDLKQAMIDWWGPVFWETYGASEIGFMTMASSADAMERPGTAGDTASRIAIWRSLLPYRVGAIAVSVVVVATVLTAVVIAARNTPSHAVMIATDQPIAAQFRTPAGIIVADRLEPKTPYVAVEENAGQTRLRLWVPSQGYAVATVPTDWLRRLP